MNIAVNQTALEEVCTGTFRVHYWELSHYNNGQLRGKWFDLDDKTEEEHSLERQEWLDTLTEESGELCEEWIIGDTDGIPSHYVGTWDIGGDFFELMELASASYLDLEVFLIGASLGITIDSIEDAYYGQYDSDTELAYDYVDSTGMLSDVPESIQNYFDFEAFGRDLAMDFIEEDGHYFNANW